LRAAAAPPACSLRATRVCSKTTPRRFNAFECGACHDIAALIRAQLSPHAAFELFHHLGIACDDVTPLKTTFMTLPRHGDGAMSFFYAIRAMLRHADA